MEGKKNKNSARVGGEPSGGAHVVCDVKEEKGENGDDCAKKKKVEDSLEFVSVDLS